MSKASIGKSFPTHKVKIVMFKGKEIGISCTKKGAFGGSKFYNAQAKMRKHK